MRFGAHRQFSKLLRRKKAAGTPESSVDCVSGHGREVLEPTPDIRPEAKCSGGKGVRTEESLDSSSVDVEQDLKLRDELLKASASDGLVSGAIRAGLGSSETAREAGRSDSVGAVSKVKQTALVGRHSGIACSETARSEIDGISKRSSRETAASRRGSLSKNSWASACIARFRGQSAQQFFGRISGQNLGRSTRHLMQRVREGLVEIARRGSQILSGVIWFIPAPFFVAIGICTLFAPHLVAAAVAAFFVFLGVAFFVLAVKFVQFKRRIERMAKSFEARILVQGVPLEKVADPQERQEAKQMRMNAASKKILFH